MKNNLLFALMIDNKMKKYYNINVKKQQVLSFADGGETMSKLVDANKKIENAVVGGYKKVEESVVGGYKKIEDKFVDTFLKKDGETIEEAKTRVKEEQEQLEEQNRARVEETLKKSKEINDKYVK